MSINVNGLADKEHHCALLGQVPFKTRPDPGVGWGWGEGVFA